MVGFSASHAVTSWSVVSSSVRAKKCLLEDDHVFLYSLHLLLNLVFTSSVSCSFCWSSYYFELDMKKKSRLLNGVKMLIQQLAKIILLCSAFHTSIHNNYNGFFLVLVL